MPPSWVGSDRKKRRSCVLVGKTHTRVRNTKVRTTRLLAGFCDWGCRTIRPRRKVHGVVVRFRYVPTGETTNLAEMCSLSRLDSTGLRTFYACCSYGLPRKRFEITYKTKHLARIRYDYTHIYIGSRFEQVFRCVLFFHIS